MAALYIIGLLCVFGLTQGAPDASELVTADNLRSSSRIVSGWEAEFGQFPHFVSLRMVGPAGGVGACGGSILTNEWILTAAHCVARRFTWIVRFEVYNLTRPGYILESTVGFVHPQYDQTSTVVQTHDIGIVKVDPIVPYGPLVQPIRIQSSQRKDDEYPDERLTLSGYGRTGDWWLGGIIPEILYWVYQRGISQEECLTWYRYSQVIKEVTMCAMFYNETLQNACTGDSGGALTKIDEDGQLTQVGIMSFGAAVGCNSPNPSGFVRPEWYHDWIEAVTGISFDWDVADLKPITLHTEHSFSDPIVVDN